MGEKPKNSFSRHKFRFLFDVALTHPNNLKKLSKKANLAHSRHTLNMSPTTEDKDIYQKATEENRILITIDDDFKELVRNKSAGAIIIPAYLSIKELEDLLLDYIKEKQPEELWGKWEKINHDKD